MSLKLKLFFIFIFFLNLQFAFATRRSISHTTCRSYFMQNDILSKFSQEEQTNLETAVRSLANLLGKPDSEHLQTKADVDATLQKFIRDKSLNVQEILEFNLWFKDRIQYHITRSKDSRRQEALETHSRVTTLLNQKKETAIEAQKIKKILRKYNAKNLSEAFLAANKLERERIRSNNDSFIEDIMFILNYFEQLEITDPIFRSMVRYDHLAAIEYFIRKKINLNSRDFGHVGRSPLHIAVECNNNPKVIQLLIESNDIHRIDDRNASARTALHIAADISLNHDILKVLIEAGADPLQKDSMGKTSLHHVVSASKNSIKILQLLIEAKQGALLKTPSDEGELPLHIAARWGSREVVEFLIQADHGAQLNSKSGENSRNGENKKSTPLHFAIYNSIEILKALLDAGADPTLLNSKNETPIDALMVLPLQRRESAQEGQQKIELLLHATEKWKRMHPP